MDRLLQTTEGVTPTALKLTPLCYEVIVPIEPTSGGGDRAVAIGACKEAEARECRTTGKRKGR